MENKASLLMERYELGRLLGSGTFAKVFYARNIATGQAVAIKMIDKDKVYRVGLHEQIKREITVMRLVKHPNIVQLYEVMATKSKIYFALEYVKGGELFVKVAKGKLKEDVARKYFMQLINAIDFCHTRGAYHRDLKPENLLLDENENLKISDFGLSALAESRREDGLLHTTCGTPAYVAPEVVKRNGYDGAKADIWSCGVVLYVLLAGYLPFHDSNLMELYRKVEKAEYKCPSWFPPDARRLIVRMLDPNPNTRISIARIREHPWFKRGVIKAMKSSLENKDIASSSTDAGSFSSSSDDIAVSNFNAFDIISRSPGYDLSRLFEEPCQKKQSRFTSYKPAKVIITKLEEVAKMLKMKATKREGGLLQFEGTKEGKKGTLSIDAEIFEVTPTFHMVEIKKSNGDTLEYKKVLDNGLRPGLKDIVWVWQGDRELLNSPNVDRQPQNAPNVDRQPQNAPTEDRQPQASPTEDRQPQASPTEDRQPQASPTEDRQPQDSPTEDRQPQDSPTVDRQP